MIGPEKEELLFPEIQQYTFVWKVLFPILHRILKL
jgi:hypothetical protein